MSHIVRIDHLLDSNIISPNDNDMLTRVSGKWANLSKTNFINNYLSANTANGILLLDAGGKIPSNLLPASAMEYKGTWDPSGGSYPANGNVGDMYISTGTGTVSGTDFEPGDQIICRGGTTWDKIDNTEEAVSASYIRGLFSAEGGSNVTYDPTTGIFRHTNHSVSVPSLSGGNVYSGLVIDAEGHVTEVSSRTLTAADVGAAAKAFKNFSINDADTGFTWATTAGADISAATVADTIKFIAGTNITLEHDTSGKAIRITGSASYIHPTYTARNVSVSSSVTTGSNPALSVLNSLTLQSNTNGHVTAAAANTVSVTNAVKDIAGYILHNATKSNIAISYNSTSHELTVTANHQNITSNGNNVSITGSQGNVVSSLAISKDTNGHITNLSAATVNLDNRYALKDKLSVKSVTAASSTIDVAFITHLLKESVGSVTLPANITGAWFILKNTRSVSITVNAPASSNVYGGQENTSSYTLHPQSSITVISDGTDYFVI